MSTLRRRIMVLGGGDIGGFVDLGLPSGILWAVGNLVKDSQGNYSIGAETDWGTYVSWGNIDGHNEGEGYNFNSTTYDSTPGKALTASIPSNDSTHDICLARLGAPWRLPKKEDFQELYGNTDTEWATINGVAGYKFMKKSDHSVYVFFPAAGDYDGTSLDNRGSIGNYRSSSYYTSSRAYYLSFSSSNVNPQNSTYRYWGFSVRPVCKPMYSITITIEGEDVEGITVIVRDSDGISHSGTTDSNGVVQLTGVYSGYASVFTKDYYVTNGHILVNASSRTFTCGLGQRESKYLTFYSITDCTHKFSKAANYSLDGGTTWQSLAANTNLTVTAGNSVIWKATLTPDSSSGIGKFSVTITSMRFDVEGNPMSLLYGDNFIGKTDLTGKSYAFYYLFSSNKGVVNAQNIALPATTLANSCYYGMFNACTSLTTAPELPATTLAQRCYEQMFSSCSSLTTAPELPATTLANYCYQYMFGSCTSLTAAPTTLPATTLANSCYCFMFNACTSLTTAPELPATTLANYCYQYMFNGCTSLNYIKCMATNISATDCVDSWVTGVAASGTFVKDGSMTDWPTGNDGIPSGWTVVVDCYVDFGLSSGRLWAVGNIVKDSQGNYSIGSETDYGTYISWGNIVGHNEGEGYNFSATNYNNTAGKSVSADIAANDSDHDFALAALGLPCHLPTKEDFQELYDNTDSEWVSDYKSTGVAGRKLMKKTDHSVYIFLPASGYFASASISNKNTRGVYWSSSWYSSNNAYYLKVDSSEVGPQLNNYRRVGMVVRPVI